MPSAAGTPSPTTSSPAYLAGYSARERKAYAAAVDSYESFSRTQEVLLAKGKATSRARTFYKKYTADWRSYWARLDQRQQAHLRVVGRSRTISIRPGKVGVAPDGSGAITLRVCGVARGVKVIQHGTPVPQPTATPHLVKVVMVRTPPESWWRVFRERLGTTC
ncbi:hypothetical protein [Nocardioides terrisoli]|uniref:hypothetical protein n=1 Tax=Nocardioides terrisoli TaxID=3388267 RepID=UPI00287BA683|nr:hypothetical protein [Nocardioides marmorisolisilvae]